MASVYDCGSSLGYDKLAAPIQDMSTEDDVEENVAQTYGMDSSM